jgi:DNA-binding transcriptional LysR family regulator
MDLDLAKTFVEIAAAGTMVKAAQRLHVTQATVSARLQNLESELDVRLFVRNKSGTQLTPAGQTLLPYATELIRTWTQATEAVKRPLTPLQYLRVAGEFSLWSAVLLNWLIGLRTVRPGLNLEAKVAEPTELLDDLQHGRLDMAVFYSPHRRPGLSNVLILEEELVAVSTSPHQESLDPSNYVYADWGPDFRAQHELAFPELRHPRTQIGLGPLALRYLLRVGGTGFFRTRAIADHCEAGRLHLIENTPKFSYSLYAAYSDRADMDLIEWAKGRLVQAASEPCESWA